MKTNLYQRSSTGKIKFHEFRTEGAEFICTWGLLGGATQTTTKTCVGMNIGKANETTPEQQAELELKAKMTKKMKEGYSTELPGEIDTNSVALDLDNLPVNFCPSKPISKMPDKLLTDPNKVYGQRKHNGHCLILVRGKGAPKVYTRRMEEITPYVENLPVIKDAAKLLPEGSFVLFECVYHSNTHGKEMPRFVAQVIRKKDSTECRRRYDTLSTEGKFQMIPLDALFLNGEFIGECDHTERTDFLSLVGYSVPEIYFDWQKRIEKAKKEHWEGFVVRKVNDSAIGYSLDGKAKRMGGWKFKFLKEDDFVVDSVEKGKSGKHAGFYAQFHVIQYDPSGNVIDRGFVGAGTLPHDDLKQLTEDIDSGARKLPFVVEIEYQSIHDDSGKLEFGQIQRLRDDKTPAECVCEE